MPSEDMLSDKKQATSDEANALLSRLKVIEGQPLDQRAIAFAQLHDQLRLTLEGTDDTGSRD